MDRNNNSEIQILDDSGTIVATQTIEAGDVQSVYSLSFDNVHGRYVRVQKKTAAGVLNIAEVQVMGWLLRNGQLTQPPSNLSRKVGTVASQSTTCWNGAASRAIDGNTNGQWGGNSVMHTCQEAAAWWMVDLGANKQYTITSVSIYNRSDCCVDRNYDSDIQILDESGTVVVATQSIEAGDVKSVYNLNFGSVMGRYVRVQKKSSGVLNIAEVKVIGY